MSQQLVRCMFTLPDDILREIVQEWLTFKDLPPLDIALCNNKSRPSLFHSVSGLLESLSQTYRARTSSYLCWLHNRGMKLRSLLLIETGEALLWEKQISISGVDLLSNLVDKLEQLHVCTPAGMTQSERGAYTEIGDTLLFMPKPLSELTAHTIQLMRTLLVEEDPRDHGNYQSREMEYRFTTKLLPSSSMEIFIEDDPQKFPFVLLIRFCASLLCPTDVTLNFWRGDGSPLPVAHDYMIKAQNMTWPAAFPHVRSFTYDAAKTRLPLWITLLPCFLDKCINLKHLDLTLNWNTDLIIPTSVWVNLLHRLESFLLICVNDYGLEVALRELKASGTLDNVTFPMKRLELHRLRMSSQLMQLMGCLLPKLSLTKFVIGRNCFLDDHDGSFHPIEVSEWLSVMDCSELEAIDFTGVNTDATFWQLLTTRATALTSVALRHYTDRDVFTDPVGWTDSLSAMSVPPLSPVRRLDLSILDLGREAVYPPNFSVSRCILNSPFTEIHNLNLNYVSVYDHDLLAIAKHLLQLRHLHIGIQNERHERALTLESISADAWKEIATEQAAYKHRRDWNIFSSQYISEAGLRTMVESLAGYLHTLYLYNRNSTWTAELSHYLTSQQLVHVWFR